MFKKSITSQNDFLYCYRPLSRTVRLLRFFKIAAPKGQGYRHGKGHRDSDRDTETDKDTDRDRADT